MEAKRYHLNGFTLSAILCIIAGCIGTAEIGIQPASNLSEVADCLQISQGSLYQLSGTLRYEQPQFKNGSVYLDLANPVLAQKPVRHALLQIVDTKADRVLATGFTDNSGNYALRYNDSEGPTVKLRVLPRIYANNLSPVFQTSDHCSLFLSVLDNTSEGALYAMSSAEIPKGNTTLNMTALHNGVSRSAAVFSILDSALLAAETIRSAKSDIIFPPLNLYWSVNNTTVSGNIRTGLIGTSFFGQDIFTDDVRGAIYLLGAAGIDTDEFDANVITHEFAHYLEYYIYRTDSVGGSHGISSRLDLSLAFSEAWGNFFSAVVRQNSLYFDSKGPNNSSGTTIQLETQPGDNIYNETSVQAALWDIYDPANDDGANCGLQPISDAFFFARNLTGLMSYMTFSTALTSLNPPCLNGALPTIQITLGSGAIGNAFSVQNIPATGGCRSQVYGSIGAAPFSDLGTLALNFSSGGTNNYCAIKWYTVTGDGSGRDIRLTGISPGCNLNMDISQGMSASGFTSNAETGGSALIANFSFKSALTYVIRIRVASTNQGVTSCNYTLSIP